MINYNKKSLSQLKALATKHFNKFIRERDLFKPCISCGKSGDANFLQAGHYLSGGHHPGLKFNEHNTNGQCVKCNMYLSGNLINYRIGLIKRIGEDGVKSLEDKAAIFKRTGYKWDRFVLIAIIEKYK